MSWRLSPTTFCTFSLVHFFSFLVFFFFYVRKLCLASSALPRFHELSCFFFLLQPLSTKSAFQRHKQWLKHAKKKSARQKIMRVYYCDAEDSRKSLQWWEKILVNVKLFPVTRQNQIYITRKGQRYYPLLKMEALGPKGELKTQIKCIRNSSLDESKFLLPGDGIAKIFPANIPAYRKV
ncbi:hypothetical protein CARUB_v10012780mg [Capsella rubella]|uniref:Uncharacterized protein n=1 Tax=Capsella rubella TaxID=81985 RepID=R0GL58_9BRAS|nr:hypothetical protein CARUB_v10012780mg [Capsella rubella]